VELISLHLLFTGVTFGAESTYDPSKISRLMKTIKQRRKKEKGFLKNFFCPCLFFFFETGSCYVTQIGLKLLILLPQLPECQDYRSEPPHLVFFFKSFGNCRLENLLLCGTCKCSFANVLLEMCPECPPAPGMDAPRCW
jgi:hypothetical protein